MNATAYYRELNRYKYQLCEDFMYLTDIRGFEVDLDLVKLDKDGVLTILKFYAWDGPNGMGNDGHAYMRASLVHDVLYQLIRLNKLTRDQVIVADKLFIKMLKDDGMSVFRAWYWYAGLRLANGKAARPKPYIPAEVFLAPAIED